MSVTHVCTLMRKTRFWGSLQNMSVGRNTEKRNKRSWCRVQLVQYDIQSFSTAILLHCRIHDETGDSYSCHRAGEKHCTKLDSMETSWHPQHKTHTGMYTHTHTHTQNKHVLKQHFSLYLGMWTCQMMWPKTSRQP